MKNLENRLFFYVCNYIIRLVSIKSTKYNSPVRTLSSKALPELHNEVLEHNLELRI